MTTYYTKYFFGIIILLLNSFNAVWNFCGSEIQNKTDSYPANSVIYASINECNCSTKNICIRKCCDLNYILKDGTCVSSNTNQFKAPPVYENGDVIKDSVAIRFVPGMVKCVDSKKDEYIEIYPHKYPEHDIYIQRNGRLFMSYLNMFFDYDQYCLDYAEEIGVVGSLCFEDAVEDFNFADRLSFVGAMISLPFLLATFIVYALLPERNLHGMSLMCYVFSLFMAYLLPITMFYSGAEHMTLLGCRAMGMTYFFCFMASIFWMNVMSYDICSTFSGTRGYSINKRKEERKRFLMYSLYAWGVPLLLIALVVTLSNTVKPNVWYDPGVRGAECFLRDGYPELLYYYGPLAVLITANIIMFVVTAWKIKRVQRDTAMLSRSGSKKHGDEDKQTFQLYIRLLFAMGLNWSMEIVNWAVNWKVKNVPPAVWYLTDFFNAAYGVAIFFLFVFKKNIWKALKKRYYTITGKSQSQSNSTGSTLMHH